MGCQGPRLRPWTTALHFQLQQHQPRARSAGCTPNNHPLKVGKGNRDGRGNEAPECRNLFCPKGLCQSWHIQTSGLMRPGGAKGTGIKVQGQETTRARSLSRATVSHGLHQVTRPRLVRLRGECLPGTRGPWVQSPALSKANRKRGGATWPNTSHISVTHCRRSRQPQTLHWDSGVSEWPRSKHRTERSPGSLEVRT